MSGFNFDENTMNKLKDMMDNGNLNDVISQIPPEMIENFSSMMKNNNTSSGSNTEPDMNKKTKEDLNQNFDLNNLDMNTIIKMKSVIEKMNDKNDPRSNLLYSLKPYLRDGRKQKLDQYANFLNIAKVAELLKNDNKENKKSE